MLGSLINVCINVKVSGGKAITVKESFERNPEICVAKTTLTEICVIGRRLKCVIAVITLTTIKSKSLVILERNIENKSCSTT